jgi:hypothetical protein
MPQCAIIFTGTSFTSIVSKDTEKVDKIKEFASNPNY